MTTENKETRGRLIMFKNGNRNQLPTLEPAEPAFCIDDNTFWIGSEDGNKRIAMAEELSTISVEDGSISFDKLESSLQNEINEFVKLNDIPIASSSQNGLMTAEMYDKLNNMDGNTTQTNVIDNLTSLSSTDALSARQGRTLDNKIGNLSNLETTNKASLVEAINEVRDEISDVANETGGGTVKSVNNISPDSVGNINITIPSQYTLPNATSSTLGGVKVGSNIDVSSGTISVKSAPTSQKGLVQLNDTVNSTSIEEAATARAVKEAYDKAVEAVNNGGGGGIENKVSTLTVGMSLSGTIGAMSLRSGFQNVASGDYSFAQGRSSSAIGGNSHAQGSDTRATGDNSHAQGDSTKANDYASNALGVLNAEMSGSSTSYSTNNTALVIGNGSGSFQRTNAFRVMFNGSTYGVGAFNTTGADYAEYFEWLDSNTDNEDRVGYFVTLEDEKIKIANSDSDYILGVISATPSIVGDSHQDQWQGMYVKDIWGRIQNEYVDVEYETIDEEGNAITKTRQDYVHKINPNYDNTEEYIGREDRKEWSAVGMLGKLLVRDDGTCKVNGYCTVADGGIATKSDKGYRVIKRVDDNIVQVIFK